MVMLDELEPFLTQAIAFETQAIAAMLVNVDDADVQRVPQGRLDKAKLPEAVRGMFRSTKSVARTALTRLLVSFPERQNDSVAIESFILQRLVETNHDCARRIKSLGSRSAHDQIFDEAQCEAMHALYQTQWLSTKNWGEWFPFLPQDWSIRKTIENLPGIAQDQVPEVIRHYESPDRATSLPGAISLERHDILHIVLQRGLLDQDEAFVIGATMGSTQSELSSYHVARMMNAFSRIYPEPYRISETKLQAYAIGVQLFGAMTTPRLNSFPLERLIDLTPRELRQTLAIDSERLARAYEEETRQIPCSLETYRLKKLLVGL